MPSQKGQQNILATAANGSNHCCCCGGWPVAQGGSQQTLPNDGARAEFPRSSSPHSACAGMKECESKGQQAPVRPRNRRWEQLAKPPRGTGHPREGLRGPAARGWEWRCPNPQHHRQWLPISGCPAETPFCSQALALRASPAESRGINEESGVPPPHGGTQRGISTCN